MDFVGRAQFENLPYKLWKNERRWRTHGFSHNFMYIWVFQLFYRPNDLGVHRLEFFRSRSGVYRTGEVGLRWKEKNFVRLYVLLMRG